MADVHTTIRPIDGSNNQVVFQNPGVHPLPGSAGKNVTVIASQVHGTLNNGSTNVPQIVFDNPG